MSEILLRLRDAMSVFQKEVVEVERRHLESLRKIETASTNALPTPNKLIRESQIARLVDKISLGHHLTGSDWNRIGRSLDRLEPQILGKALNARPPDGVWENRLRRGLLRSWDARPSLSAALEIIEDLKIPSSDLSIDWVDFRSPDKLLRRLLKIKSPPHGAGNSVRNVHWLAEIMRLPPALQIDRLLEEQSPRRREVSPWQTTEYSKPLSMLSATSVAVALLAWAKHPESPSAVRLIDAITQNPSIGDPRGIRLSAIWHEVREIIPAEVFKKLLGSLNRGDIQFFFKNLSGLNDDRRDFWLSYTDQMVRTYVILKPDESKRLEQNFRPESEERTIVDRAYTFSKSGPQNLLVFVFDDFAAVEAGTTGQACFVYDKNLFERIIGSRLNRSSENIVSGSSVDFNSADQASIRQPHFPPGKWQTQLGKSLEQRYRLPAYRKSS